MRIILLCLLLFCTAPATAQTPGELPREYLLDDTKGAVAFYPGSAYRSSVDKKYEVKSIEDIEVRLELLPAHTLIHWTPARWSRTGKPLLFGKEAAGREVRRFCMHHHLDLEMTPPPAPKPADPALH